MMAPNCPTSESSCRDMGLHHKHCCRSPLWQSAMKLVTKRRAAELTCVSLQRMLQDVRDQDKFSSASKDLQLQVIEMEIVKQKAQMDLINMLERMQTDQKIDLLFTLIDTKKNNKISVPELARAFHLIRGSPDDQHTFEESIQAAKLTMVANDTSGDGFLELNDFITFIESMSIQIQKSKGDIVDSLIIDITTFYDEKVITEESMEHCNITTLTKRKKLTRRKFTTHERVRLYVLFQFIDGQDGEYDDQVMFNQVVEALAPVFKIIDKEYSTMLFFGDYDESKFRSQMDFIEFKELIDNAMGACQNEVTVDHIANAVTRNLSRDKDARETYDKFIHAALSTSTYKDHTTRDPQKIAEGGLKESSSPILVTDHFDKELIRHLFNLWDTKKTRTLDVNDLFMGFRKFQKSKKLDETLNDVLRAIRSVQEKSQDGRGIELHQFEEIIIDFATEIDADVDDLVRFMYYQTIYVRNHSSETRSWEDELEFVKNHSSRNKLDFLKFIPNFDEFRKSKNNNNNNIRDTYTRSNSAPSGPAFMDQPLSRVPSTSLQSSLSNMPTDDGSSRGSPDEREGPAQDGFSWINAIKVHIDNLAQEEVSNRPNEK
mmetsp:Transcript_16485/g.23251  ORF Transcript_16485/g.23251 Transcript_16485/m.23251 type:complete len:601 (+) Transcript_16485:99-1901(+)